ncbi:MAG: hypothetical protein HAW67_05295 [Endozoicomonadaceae bacterium]|nr:hypothetical protein [Endozoicomonadaceae bacterium]
MKTINKSEVRKTIRAILPPKFAKVFIMHRTAIMSLACGLGMVGANERLTAALSNKGDVNLLVESYKALEQHEFEKTEIVDAFKTVSGKVTLLNHLTDGARHFTLYNDVSFIQPRPTEN